MILKINKMKSFIFIHYQLLKIFTIVIAITTYLYNQFFNKKDNFIFNPLRMRLYLSQKNQTIIMITLIQIITNFKRYISPLITFALAKVNSFIVIIPKI